MTHQMSILMMTALVAALAIFADKMDADEHSGTWKLNPARSKYTPGPAPKNMTETIVLDQHAYKVDANGTAADGTPIHIELNAKFDSKDYPIIGVPWGRYALGQMDRRPHAANDSEKRRPGHDAHNLQGFHRWKDTQVHAKRLERPGTQRGRPRCL
jgi:hypothetical protein